MKKLTILAIVLVIVSVGCSTQQNPDRKDFTFHATCNSCVNVRIPILSPINLCSGGYSPYPKVVGWKDSMICVLKDEWLTIPNDSLTAGGWHHFQPGTRPIIGHSGFKSGWWPGWGNIFLLILAIAALLLLWELLSFLRRKNAERAAAAAVKTTDPLIVSEKPFDKKEGQNISETKSNIGKEDYVAIADIIAKLHERSVGGEVKLGGENGLYIKVSNSIPEINLHADRGSTIENIDITVADVHAHTIDNHEGPDNRNFSRNTKKEDPQDH